MSVNFLSLGYIEIHMFRFILFLLVPFSVIAQDYTSFFTGDTQDVTTDYEFGICLMGGASENDNAMRWFLNKAAGGDVVVLRASGSDGYNDYFFSELGVTINSVETLLINNSAGAVDPYVLQQVANAEAIWFAGGDQSDYVNYFKGNAMQELLNTHINEKLAVIGGTSAGMAIMGAYYFDAQNGTVTSAEALNNPYRNDVSLGYNDFLMLPFLDNVITDTHYDDPDRRGRHSVFMARYATDTGNRPRGIACEEFTAVCIDNTGDARVFGDFPDNEDYAYFLQANCTNFTVETCEPGTPLTWVNDEDAVRVYKVPGTQEGSNTFSLESWSDGEGGTWEHWTVDQAEFIVTEGEDPLCYLLETSDFETTHVKVFPNPFCESISIRAIQGVSVALYSFDNKLIFSEQNITTKSISTSQLKSGLYFLKVNHQGKTEILKLIKK